MGGKKGGNNKKNKSQNPNGNIPDWSLPKTLVEEM